MTRRRREIQREYVLSSHEDSVAEARGHVRAVLGASADPDTVGQVELVVSELVTNSVRHGPGEPITLWLAANSAGDIIGEVRDQGGGAVALLPPDAQPEVGGLGLVVVDALTTAWGVHPDSTSVWFRFAAAA